MSVTTVTVNASRTKAKVNNRVGIRRMGHAVCVFDLKPPHRAWTIKSTSTPESKQVFDAAIEVGDVGLAEEVAELAKMRVESMAD